MKPFKFARPEWITNSYTDCKMPNQLYFEIWNSGSRERIWLKLYVSQPTTSHQTEKMSSFKSLLEIHTLTSIQLIIYFIHINMIYDFNSCSNQLTTARQTPITSPTVSKCQWQTGNPIIHQISLILKRCLAKVSHSMKNKENIQS
jgi:hypothetical protein